jgi:hypothetical protein
MMPGDPGSLVGPTLTREAAERLLPGKGIDTNECTLWTADDERQLQASWTSRDQAVLDNHSSKTPGESPFWRLLLQQYQRHPYDLFKYGLKYDDSVLRDREVKMPSGQVHKCKNPGYLSQSICESLELLLAHPIWNRDLSLVRYALQIAVMHRVPGHITPIWPCVYSDACYAVRDAYLAEDQVEAADDISFVAYANSSPHTRPEIRELCVIIDKTVQKDKPISRPDDGDLPREQVLFLLQHKDVTTVKEAIAAMRWDGRPRYRSCETHLEEYKSHLAGGKKGAYPPVIPRRYDNGKGIVPLRCGATGS